MARFESRVLTTELELEALAPEWERLRRELAEPWIEQHPAWLAAEGRASAGLMVVVLREGGQVRAIAPFLLRRWNWPCRIGYTTVAAFPMLVARLAGDALLGSCDPAVQEALLDAVATAPIPYHTLHFEGLALASPLRKLVDTSPLLQRGYWFYSPTEPSKRWRTRIPASFAAYEASLGKKRRYQFRTAGRKLDEAVGEPVLIERVTKPAEMGAFLKSVERISALSWQGRRLGQVLEVESTGARKLKELAERGWFRGYLLRAEGEAIAFVIGFQSDKRYVYEKIGYDPAWGEHSPGNVLLYRLIEDLCSFEPPEWLDFGFGESQYKRVFGNDWYEEQNVYLIRRSLYTGMARATQRVFRATSDEARRVLDRLGLRERVRRILRGAPEEPTTKRDPV